jgi:hypothetical protein
LKRERGSWFYELLSVYTTSLDMDLVKAAQLVDCARAWERYVVSNICVSTNILGKYLVGPIEADVADACIHPCLYAEYHCEISR